MRETYEAFLENKIAVAKETGFKIEKSEINSALMPHQRDTVLWALRGGRRAVFCKFGLGKTVIGLEFAHQVVKHEGGKALIVLPLGVKQEFTHDATELLKYEKPEYIRSMDEANESKSEILLTNYERVRDGDVDPKQFTATVLDEAAVLRSFGSKTYQTFLDKFKDVKYKLVATATPDPNKYKELIHYAGYLEIMDTGQALTRFFQRNSTQANDLTIYPHKEREFWLWVSSWALCFTKPSDLCSAYSDEGYVLPKLEIRKHKIASDSVAVHADRDGQLELQLSAAVSLKDAAEIKKSSIQKRVAKMKEIVEAEPNEHFILWHDREEERHCIKKAIPTAVEIYGSQDIEIRERNVIDFAEGKTQYLATKKCLSGSGCNFQKHCHRAIFVGIDYEFNDFIQAVHRIYRFLQTEKVIIDIIYMDTETEILKVLFEKWERFDYQTQKMVDILKEYGLSNSQVKAGLVRTMTPEEAISNKIEELEYLKKGRKMDKIIKTYKGFNENLCCRDMQYEIGKSYEEPNAVVCKKGFHACERPLDVFKYYPPATSRFCETEQSGEISKASDDTKVSSTKIKIGAEIGIPGLVKAQIEWTKAHTTNEHTDLDRATAGEYGAATAGKYGAATAGNCGAATAGKYGAATAGYRGAATAGEYGAATAGYGGAATAGYGGAATAGYGGAATAGNCGAATAGYGGAATAGDCGAATAGDCGAATAGNRGAATSKGSATVGANGLAVVRGYGVKVRGGLGAILVIAEENAADYNVKNWIAVQVDGVEIKSDTWYKLNKDGQLEEICELKK